MSPVMPVRSTSGTAIRPDALRPDWFLLRLRADAKLGSRVAERIGAGPIFRRTALLPRPRRVWAHRPTSSTVRLTRGAGRGKGTIVSRAKPWTGRRGILLGSILVTMLAGGQASTLIARADPPVDPPGVPSADAVQPVVPDAGSSNDVPGPPDVTIAQAIDPSGEVLSGGSITYVLTVR